MPLSNEDVRRWQGAGVVQIDGARCAVSVLSSKSHLHWCGRSGTSNLFPLTWTRLPGYNLLNAIFIVEYKREVPSGERAA